MGKLKTPIWESVKISLSSLRANKLRSILTLIGVIIGVTSIITMVSLISGFNKLVADQLATLGSTTFIVEKFGIILSDDDWFDAMKRKDLTLADYQAVVAGCTECEEVALQKVSNRKVKYGREHFSRVPIVGITPNYMKVVALDDIVDKGQGRVITEFENDHRRQVVILGPELTDKFFPMLDPIGKKVRIGDADFTVVGVPKKRGSFLGDNQDRFAAIPFSVYQKYFSNKLEPWEGLQFYIKAKDYPSMEKAQDQVRAILRARRHVPYHDKDDFGMYTAETLMDLFKQVTTGISFTLVGIVSISLLVGGIVIMNIMLVSVTERTREIGVRKALGARRRSILSQFLIESVTLAVVGGTMGILLGVFLAKLISWTTPIPAAIEPWSILAGLLVSTGVGVFFGVFPAAKAARLDPIEALRYE